MPTQPLEESPMDVDEVFGQHRLEDSATAATASEPQGLVPPFGSPSLKASAPLHQLFPPEPESKLRLLSQKLSVSLGKEEKELANAIVQSSNVGAL